MFDPQLETDGPATCPKCGGEATGHGHPDYPFIDIECESCGTTTVSKFEREREADEDDLFNAFG